MEAWGDHVAEVHISVSVFGSHDPMHMLVVLEDFAGALEHGESIRLVLFEVTDFLLAGQNSIDDNIFLLVSKRLAVVDH